MFRVAVAALAAIGCLVGTGQAFAQESAVGNHGYYAPYGHQAPYRPDVATPDRRARTYRDPPVAARPYAPHAYGWAFVRPADCGEFRYWNGTRCADARDEPPYVGPKW